jgi:hypothetical protein
MIKSLVKKEGLLGVGARGKAGSTRGWSEEQGKEEGE